MFSEKDLICADNYIAIADLALIPSVSSTSSNTRQRNPSRFSRWLFRHSVEASNNKAMLQFPSRDEIVFFVKTDFLNYFAGYLRPHLRQTFRIITGHSDYTIPYGGAGDFSSLLEDDLLAGWYGYNIVADHPKLKPVPLGIPSKIWLELGNQAGGHTLFAEKLNVFLRNPAFHKSKLVYWGCPGATTESRASAYDAVKDIDYVSITERKSYCDYLDDLSRHKFVCCPDGNGIDTHRLWESLYFQAIPVVKRNHYLNLYAARFPVLYINDWSELSSFTEEFLDEQYAAMISTAFRPKLRFEYWEREIKSGLSLAR
ncbi:MAG: hypothetical protein V1736_01475 [Pseudomonadota bacterium]